jgi:hypothetical protein
VAGGYALRQAMAKGHGSVPTPPGWAGQPQGTTSWTVWVGMLAIEPAQWAGSAAGPAQGQRSLRSTAEPELPSSSGRESLLRTPPIHHWQVPRRPPAEPTLGDQRPGPGVLAGPRDPVASQPAAGHATQRAAGGTAPAGPGRSGVGSLAERAGGGPTGGSGYQGETWARSPTAGKSRPEGMGHTAWVHRPL